MSYYPFPACKKVYKSNTGSIKSPNFPSNYPNSAICSYLIMNSDPESRITLNFLHFNLHQANNQCFDYVKIYDGNSTKATQIGRKDGYCGKRAPPTLTMASAGNSLLVLFVFDRRQTNLEFNATYRGKIVINYFIFYFCDPKTL